MKNISIDKKQVQSIQLRHGLENLTRCPECEQLTLEKDTSWNYLDGNVYWRKCHYCGYIYNSTWTDVLHGKLYQQPNE